MDLAPDTQKNGNNKVVRESARWDVIFINFADVLINEVSRIRMSSVERIEHIEVITWGP